MFLEQLWWAKRTLTSKYQRSVLGSLIAASDYRGAEKKGKGTATVVTLLQPTSLPAEATTGGGVGDLKG